MRERQVGYEVLLRNHFLASVKSLVFVFTWAFCILLGSGFQMKVCEAKIYEVLSFKQVEPHVTSDTLLIVDVDNTLIEPTSEVGSDQWFYSLYHRFGKQPAQDPKLDEAIVGIWNDVQSQIQVRPVEAFTPAFLKKIQKQGIKTLALTARTGDLIAVTSRQLKSAGYEFQESAIHARQLVLSKDLFGTQESARYESGILAVGESNNKGRVLTAFLEKIGLKPQKVVFVDDRAKHVKTMELALFEKKIPYLGFRYGALDEKVKAFKKRFESLVAQKQVEVASP